MNSFTWKKARKGIFMTSQNAVAFYFYVQLAKHLETLMAQLTGANATAGTQYCTYAVESRFSKQNHSYHCKRHIDSIVIFILISQTKSGISFEEISFFLSTSRWLYDKIY